MTRKLDSADQAAVDMMFDRINAKGDGNSGDSMVAVTRPVSDTNLAAVEKVLDLLGQMPAPDPPVDLATRTLQRVAHGNGAAIPAMPAYINPDQPMA